MEDSKNIIDKKLDVIFREIMELKEDLIAERRKKEIQEHEYKLENAKYELDRVRENYKYDREYIEARIKSFDNIGRYND